MKKEDKTLVKLIDDIRKDVSVDKRNAYVIIRCLEGLREEIARYAGIDEEVIDEDDKIRQETNGMLTEEQKKINHVEFERVVSRLFTGDRNG